MPEAGGLRISIVTPSYNQARFLRETIESVLAQEGDFDLEYLVVDGGSSDGSLRILDSYRGRLVWVSEPDRGQVDAINKGLARCTGDVVGWPNSDDLLLPGALDRAAHAFQSRSEVEWVHGRCWIIDENGKRIRRWVEAYKHYRARRHSFERLLLENYVSQMTVFWRRSLLDTVGYLDPTYPLAFDYELWLRFAVLSVPSYIELPQACFRWYEASKSGAGFEAQFAENAGAAEAHCTGRGHALRARRRLSQLFVVIYKMMASGRRLARALRPR